MSYRCATDPFLPCHIGWWLHQLVRRSTPILHCTRSWALTHIHLQTFDSASFSDVLQTLPVQSWSAALQGAQSLADRHPKDVSEQLKLPPHICVKWQPFSYFSSVSSWKISFLIWPTHWAQWTILILHFKRSPILVQWPFWRSVSVSHRRMKARTLWGVQFLFLGRLRHFCRSASGDSGNFSTQNLFIAGKEGLRIGCVTEQHHP